MSELKPEELQRAFRKRAKLIEEAFGTPSEGDRKFMALRDLIALLKERGRDDKDLSYLYFAGAEGDHPYFLLNDRIAIGIAVLPEDAAKTRVSKRHPNQQEIIVVLEGRLILESETRTADVELRQGQVAVVEKGECHRILPAGNDHGAYLFVKTNPADMPREERCDS